MSVSSFSVLNALLVYSAMLGVICLMCKWTAFLEKGGASVLWAASIAAVLRLLLPFELPLANEIRFWTLLGIPQRFFRENPAVVDMLLAAWAAGTAVFIIRDFWKLRLAYRKCRSYSVVKNERVQEIAAQVGIKCPVLLSPDVETPYVVGIFRCTVYLPYAGLDGENTRLILMHEAQHIKSHDALIRLVFGILSEAVWWNFLARPFQNAVDRILEVRCDRNVTKHMTEREKSEYLDMLLKMADRIVTGKENLALAMNEFGVVGRKKTVIRQRFMVVDAVRRGRSSRYVGPIGQCLVLALFFASYLLIFQSAGLAPSENFVYEQGVYYRENQNGIDFRDVISGVFILKESDGRYKLFVDYKFSRYLTENEVCSDEYQDLHIFEEDKE